MSSTIARPPHASVSIRALAGVYLDAKRDVIELGFAGEIDWQSEVSLSQLSEAHFLRESAWVILSSGMRESVIRTVFPNVSEAFLGWRSAREICSKRSACRKLALQSFCHRPKVDAILGIAQFVAANGIESVRMGLDHSGASFLLQFRFLGPATSCHLAKNLGVDVPKPDRHLRRIAALFDCDSVNQLCAQVAEVVPDPSAVVDLVFWRYATLHSNYLDRLILRYWDEGGSLRVPKPSIRAGR